MIKLTLPVPPSVNNLYINLRGRGRARTKEYRQWIKEAGAHLMLQHRSIKPIRGRCVLAIRVPAHTSGDCSNRIKAVEDLLVAHGITGDDKHNWKVSVERDPEISMCEIEVSGLK